MWRNGVVLNPEKFVFSAPTVGFAGFTITMTDLRPCSRYTEVTRDFPEPRNINDVRSWFGLVNQAAYAFSMTERMHPFRKLLKNGERFTWSPELEDIFRESKDVIVQAIERGVRIFDQTKPACIATYWSKEGIGFWLFQKHSRCSSVGSALRSSMNTPDDNAAIVNNIPSEPDDDDHYIEEDNLTGRAAGLESLRSMTWDRVREATGSDVDVHTLEEMATDGIPDMNI